MENKIKLIIFDFDGVLADSFDTFYSLVRDAGNHIGLSITPDQYRGFFMGNVHQGFIDFLKDQKQYSMFLEFRSSNYDKYFNDGRHKAKLFSEALDFLKEISKNHTLTIASAGRQKNVEELLEKNHAKDLFSLIIADGAISKTDMIEKILDKFGAVPEKTVMITDTVGDIITAKKSGLKTIAVTWGFHSEKILKAEKPDYLANSFKMLYKKIKAF